jgi:hypothetical protein
MRKLLFALFVATIALTGTVSGCKSAGSSCGCGK